MKTLTSGDLAPAPYNPRTISAQDDHELALSLKEFGDLAPVVFNVRTGRLIGGHQRNRHFGQDCKISKKAASDEFGTVALGHIQTPFGLFAYREVDWPEAKEMAANLAANNHGGEFVHAAVLDVLEVLAEAPEFNLELTGFTLPELEAWVEPAPKTPKTKKAGTHSEAEEPLINQGDVPDALFPSNNDHDIPTLLLEMQADFVDLPVKQWGTLPKTAKRKLQGGTWHFYTDDYKFNALWSCPQKLLNTQCPTAIEPNFSTSDQMPVAVGLYHIYRKRWLARYWQENGVRILVDLNVSPKLYDYALLGVPTGWRAYATRGYTDQIKSLEAEHALARNHAQSENIIFLVYGGRKQIRAWCQQNGAIWVPEHMSVQGHGGKDAQSPVLTENCREDLENGE